MQKLFTVLLGVLILGFSVSYLQAGGSGLNVVIVVNQNSTNSVQLGNYYRQMRQVPPQNFLRINWPTNGAPVTDWSLTDFTNVLVNPLVAMLSSRQLTNQIDYVVLSMDIPYRVGNGTTVSNSTTSALFYGFKNDTTPGGSCGFAPNSTNLYAGSEGIFRATPPVSTNNNSWLVTMITASNLAVAEMVIAQGAASDGTFPTNTVMLGKSVDGSRNVRYSEFDNTVFGTRLRGDYSTQRTNIFSPQFNFQILGYENGDFSFSTPEPNPLFVPGAMADNLTSFGGQIFENSGQSTLLPFLSFGASGAYGTVDEPCDYQEKFPNSQNYFYQSRGFSLGECYYQSVTNPYQGLVIGEPLAAPFAQPGTGAWNGLASNAVISGTANLSVQFTASDALHPLQQLDLFLDGTWLQTVTNIAPQSGNVLNVSLNGFATSYTVLANATVKSITSNLVSVLNGTTYQNNTKVAATAHGDRVELQSIAAYTKLGTQIPLSASSTNSSGSLTTFLRASPTNPTNFLDSIAEGIKGYDVRGTFLANSTFTLAVTKTNAAIATVTITNNGNATLGEFVHQFLTAVDLTSSLQGLDGMTAGDLVTNADGSEAIFNLQANGQGYAAAQIKATVSASLGVLVTPTGGNNLTDNIADLRPRNHLYVTAGVTNLSATIPFNTTSFADGYHELAAVAYEGSHVRTQTRATQTVIIKNSALSATLTPILSGTNSALQPTLQFLVAANTNNITNIQLFSTGGLLGSAAGQSSATFSVTLSNLDIGLHPFYAIVTDNTGRQYRTQTDNVGLAGVSYAGSNLFGIDYSFPLQVTGPTPLLVWPATAGRTYQILSTTNLLTPFQVHATVIPTSSLGQYTETDTTPAQQFYRVSVSP